MRVYIQDKSYSHNILYDIKYNKNNSLIYILNVILYILVNK